MACTIESELKCRLDHASCGSLTKAVQEGGQCKEQCADLQFQEFWDLTCKDTYVCKCTYTYMYVYIHMYYKCICTHMWALNLTTPSDAKTTSLVRRAYSMSRLPKSKLPEVRSHPGARKCRAPGLESSSCLGMVIDVNMFTFYLYTQIQTQLPTYQYGKYMEMHVCVCVYIKSTYVLVMYV